MKKFDEISRLSADDLERISLDERIPVPEELSGRVQGALHDLAASEEASAGSVRPGSAGNRFTRRVLPAVGIAAALAVVAAIGLTRDPEPADTFDDPYLAYAQVEAVFAKISGTVAYGAGKIEDTESRIDKISYWK
jgi:hypothetical protein